MSGMPNRSGGARPGAGRPPSIPFDPAFAALMEAGCPPDVRLAIVQKLAANAQAGDVRAAAFIFNYCYGRPTTRNAEADIPPASNGLEISHEQELWELELARCIQTEHHHGVDRLMRMDHPWVPAARERHDWQPRPPLDARLVSYQKYIEGLPDNELQWQYKQIDDPDECEDRYPHPDEKDASEDPAIAEAFKAVLNGALLDEFWVRRLTPRATRSRRTRHAGTTAPPQEGSTAASQPQATAASQPKATPNPQPKTPAGPQVSSSTSSIPNAPESTPGPAVTSTPVTSQSITATAGLTGATGTASASSAAATSNSAKPASPPPSTEPRHSNNSNAPPAATSG